MTQQMQWFTSINTNRENAIHAHQIEAWARK